MSVENVSELPVPRLKKKAATAAREAEARDGYVIVESCGVELKIPVGNKVPLAVIDLFLKGDEYGGTKALLGEEQWKAFTDAGANGDDYDELGTKLKEAQGN